MTDLVSSTRAAYCLAASERAKGRSRDEGEAEAEEFEGEEGDRARAAAPRSAAQHEAEEGAAAPSSSSSFFPLQRGLGDHSRSAKRQRAAGDSSAWGGGILSERELKERGLV